MGDNTQMKRFPIIFAALSIQVAFGQAEFNLREVHEDPRSMVQALSLSTAAMVPMENLLPDTFNVNDNKRAYLNASDTYRKQDPKTQSQIREAFNKEGEKAEQFSPVYRKLSDSGYCEDFSMAKQVSFSNCSGTLISDRHILTAGHCADEKNMCDDYRWVFDYKTDAKGNLPSSYTKDSVYNCKNIVASVNVKSNLGLATRLYQTFFRTDFAIIELDRPVVGRSPVELSSQKAVETGDKVFSISYPIGMPAKVNFDGEVQSGMNTSSYFWTSLIVFGGSSGGPIFSEETGELVGVISKGINTTIRDSDRKCVYEKHPDQMGDSSVGQTNSNAQMKKILEVLARKKIPVL
jgi:V8-like Glu-specific endopeptidase